MTKNVFLCFFLILVLSSNKCAKEGTAIHLYNTSNSDIFIISKSELIDLKEGFLSDQIINSRTVKTRDNRYVTFENYELETFKNKDKDYLFYILNEANCIIKSASFHCSFRTILNLHNTIMIGRFHHFHTPLRIHPGSLHNNYRLVKINTQKYIQKRDFYINMYKDHHILLSR